MHFINLPAILNLLMVYKYLIIFPISILEGPIITILSGLLVSLGSVNVYMVFLTLIAGDLVGDMIYYIIGRFGRKHFIHRWGHLIGITEDKIIHLEDRFKKHEISILLIGKTQPIGSVALATAGFVKMPFIKFMSINLIGTIIKTIIFLIIGFYFGKAYMTIDNYLTRGGIIALFVLVIGVVIYKFNYVKKQI